MTERLDALILGSGNGGMYLAWHLAQSGQRTAVVERRWIGGSCPNINCLPTKNEISGAKVADLTRHADVFGIGTGAVTVDMERVRQRKRDMVDHMIDGTRKQYENTGAELVMGSGRFVAPRTLEVQLNDGGVRTLSADRVFLNLGTHAALPVVPGLAEAQPMTNIELLETDYLPAHLIVLGGGYVGLELGQAYRRFGSRVTIVQHGAQIAAAEDSDVADELRRLLTDEGVDVIESADTVSVHGRSGSEVTVVVRTPSGERRIAGTDLLIATGRVPNTADIGLEAAGVTVDDHGFLDVNERLETTAPGVWGIGECCSGHEQFTHVSFDDYRIIRDNLAGGQRRSDDRLIPRCMFTDPQLARVGLTEREAQRDGIDVRVARLPISAVLRTQTTGETRGFMKALVGVDDRVLGFTMVGPEAGEVMAVVQMAMIAGLPYQVLRDAVLAHPTMAEGLGTLFTGVPESAVA
ncbi:FAD-dependent oxidoreductase [Mycobacterium sp. NPDC051804]|uniref:FAD-dependent oxidoreductase n=1 Tax=Mycobacterium sp. NPDC051804 TaxID=3364295 RepID=UPI00379A3E3C